MIEEGGNDRLKSNWKLGIWKGEGERKRRSQEKYESQEEYEGQFNSGIEEKE